LFHGVFLHIGSEDEQRLAHRLNCRNPISAQRDHIPNIILILDYRADTLS